MINLYKMEVFALVAREVSFSRAAKRLYMTQSAVSQHIHDLEQSLGVTLFTRNQDGIRLTPAGTRLLEYSTDLLSIAAAAEGELTDVSHLTSGTLQLGAVPHAAAYTLTPWVQKFSQIYPSLAVMVDPQTVIEQVEEISAGTEDLAFLDHNPHDPRIACVTLTGSGLRLAVGEGHPLAAWPSVRLHQLNDEPFITLEPTHHAHTWSEQYFAAHNAVPDLLGESASLVECLNALRANQASTLLPRCLIEKERGIRAVNIADAPELTNDLVLARRVDMPMRPLARAFVGLLDQDFHGILAEVHSTGK